MPFIGNKPTAVPLTSADIEDGTIQTADIADGAVTAVKTTGVGGANTPAFYAYLSSDQDITNNGFTKVQINTEVFDTDSAFDNSTNYRFTPQTSGKYFVFGSVEVTPGSDSTLQNCDPSIYKNGSRVIKGGEDYRANNPRSMSPKVSGFVELNGSTDYIELYIGNDITGGDALAKGSTDKRTHFGAYKIIE